MDIIISDSAKNMKQEENRNANAIKVLKIASIEELKEMLRFRIPQYAIMYGLVDMHIRYNIFEGTPTKFFIPTAGNLNSLIVAYHDYETPNQSGRQMIDLHWDVDKASDADIQDYLKSLPNINWDKPITVNGTNIIVGEKIKSILESPGLCGKLQTMEVFSDCDLYSNEGTFVKTTIPNGFKLGKLKPEHAAYVHEMFGNPLGESDEFVGKQFTKLPSVALYKISGECEKEHLPQSWISLRMHANIGRTFTTPEFRRRGFSTIVSMELIKIILEAGFVPKVAIKRSNTASIIMHQKLGFIKQEGLLCATFSSVT